MPDNIRAWLILGNARVRASDYDLLVDRFGEPGAIVAQSSSALRDAGIASAAADAIAGRDETLIQSELEWLQDAGHHIVTVADVGYPDLLTRIDEPPLLLYIDGKPDVLDLPSLAIVGSRNPTNGGTRNAHDFAQYLSGAGFCIISGLAQGIDAAAHHGALDGGAVTIAFLGHGIDRIYPAVNKDLARTIAAHGALVSEFPLGIHPEPRNFPQRNRLISGISLGTIVIEAARRSGSLITARLAGEQGREVFALPGSIHNPLARGCHQLIRQGAKLVETADDIVSELAPLTGHVLQNAVESTAKRTSSTDNDDEYTALADFLSHDPIHVDELVRQSGLTIDEVSSMLLILELEGKVEKLAGGHYSVLS